MQEVVHQGDGVVQELVEIFTKLGASDRVRVVSEEDYASEQMMMYQEKYGHSSIDVMTKRSVATEVSNKDSDDYADWLHWTAIFYSGVLPDDGASAFGGWQDDKSASLTDEWADSLQNVGQRGGAVSSSQFYRNPARKPTNL